MPRNKHFTNQQFLKELEKRLPDFTEDEFSTLMKLTIPYQEKVMKILQAADPQIHNWLQEKQQILEKEKADKEIEELKKSLEEKK